MHGLVGLLRLPTPYDYLRQRREELLYVVIGLRRALEEAHAELKCELLALCTQHPALLITLVSHQRHRHTIPQLHLIDPQYNVRE